MDENVLTLHIVSAHDTQTFKINWVEIESPNGNFVIYLGHAPIASLITKKSLITYQLLDSSVNSIETNGGTILLNNTIATILLD